MFPLGRSARVTIATLGALYTGAVLWLTLRPLPWATEGNQEAYGILNPRAWIGWSTWTEGSVLEIVANVLMFLLRRRHSAFAQEADGSAS